MPSDRFHHATNNMKEVVGSRKRRKRGKTNSPSNQRNVNNNNNNNENNRPDYYFVCVFAHTATLRDNTRGTPSINQSRRALCVFFCLFLKKKKNQENVHCFQILKRVVVRTGRIFHLSTKMQDVWDISFLS